MSQTIVALDCMGGDNAPGEIVKGGIEALKENKDVFLKMVGRQEDVNRELEKYDYDKTRVEVVNATEVIEHVKAITRGIRNMRAEMNVPNNKRTKVYIISSDSKLLTALEVLKESVKPLMLANDIILHYEKKEVADDAVSIVVP